MHSVAMFVCLLLNRAYAFERGAFRPGARRGFVVFAPLTAAHSIVASTCALPYSKDHANTGFKSYGDW